MMKLITKNMHGGQICIDAPDDAGVRRMTVHGDEGGYACVDMTPEMLADITSGLVSDERYFVDELGGQHFLVPADRRMDWYDYDKMLEESGEPLPLPNYVREIESLCHLEFSAPLEPFV